MGLEEKVRKLPPELQREVEIFVDSLLKEEKRKPTFKWAGALRGYSCSSLELQKKALEWR